MLTWVYAPLPAAAPIAAPASPPSTPVLNTWFKEGVCFTTSACQEASVRRLAQWWSNTITTVYTNSGLDNNENGWGRLTFLFYSTLFSWLYTMLILVSTMMTIDCRSTRKMYCKVSFIIQPCSVQIRVLLKYQKRCNVYNNLHGN